MLLVYSLQNPLLNYCLILSFIFRENDLRVIRPFIYVRERALRHFYNNQNMPAIMNVYQEISKQRQKTRQLLAHHEILIPKLFLSLKTALHGLMTFNKEEEVRVRRKSKVKEEDRSRSEDSDVETDEEPILKAD